MLHRLLTLFIASQLLASADESLSLAGEWKFALDPQDLGLAAGPSTWRFPDSIKLPGSTAAQGKGEPLSLALNLEKPAMQHLHQRHPHIGPAWYQREVSIPADWAGKDYQLTLERVLWESRVWIDGKQVGDPQLSLSVPHRYDLSKHLTPGQTHELTLRIDNRQKVEIGAIGHAYTPETQTIWNGVIGELKLEALPKVRVSHLSPRFDLEKEEVVCTVEVTNTTDQAVTLPLQLTAHPPQLNGTAPRSKQSQVQAKPGVTIHQESIPLKDWPLWSEFSPGAWTLTSKLGDTRFSIPFAPRSFQAEGRHLLINGQRTFLRGNLECAIFPQTGHPDAEGPQWEKIMRVSKEYGLNHLRFHSWCPPQVAFEAADRHGIYLQVELPNWTFKMGELPEVDAFFQAEGERIIREYGSHPSFVMFSLGNELKGKLTSMDALLAHFRGLAPDLLFTSTSYAFSPRGLLPGKEDDFFISQRTQSGWVRGQGFLNNTFPSSNSDYAEGLSCLQIPLVTHEVGQYVVYPNLAELPKYEETPLRSTAMEAIKADLTSKGLLAEAERLTRDSGKLAALLYKEDIERALRTKDLSGIQLLQLQDFPGQSTATVGLLDAFWDSKGLITPEEFRQFCAPVVPLTRIDKFVWENSETFQAKLELANFGTAPLSSGRFQVSLKTQEGEVLANKTFDPNTYPLGNGIPIGTFEADLASLSTAGELELVVEYSSDMNIRNSWPIWVYPAETPAVVGAPFVIHRGVNETCLADLAAGKRVLLQPLPGAVKAAIPARFIPVFWSPLHFPNQPGTLGASIQSYHPLWKDFPTDTHTNWQWWELTAESTAVDLSSVESTLEAPFRFVDKFNRNAQPAAIFEAKVGAGSLLVCTLDLNAKVNGSRGLVARQLERSLHRYLSSSEFAPTGRLTVPELQALIGDKEFEMHASIAHPDFPARHAGDGNAQTIWHTPWDQSAKLPASLALDLLSEKVLSGLRYTPRQGNPNGRIKSYQIQVSRDGTNWKNYGSKATFPNNGEIQTITFPQPIKTQHLRLLAHSEQAGSPYVSCAELAPIYAPPGDARNLGIIPGFND
ncbi:discoidin domain-containing protein [Roseibacillus persicicus]|uniref:Beta-galactosidase n=1 Tax=Roseibacillus persicicus TaxID=454148 RepID=A0A918TR68_9BACT|nr:discoidin domain-containing protein [Roseibacillus persicicus]GHC57444.1 beta-galactosidase [Roseibacillus persicicus]